MKVQWIIIMTAITVQWMPMSIVAQEQQPDTVTYTYTSHQEIMATLQGAVQPDTAIESITTGPHWTAVEVPVNRLIAELRDAAIQAGLTATDTVLIQIDISGHIDLVMPNGLLISMKK
jgi:hypothetical protein